MLLKKKTLAFFLVVSSFTSFFAEAKQKKKIEIGNLRVEMPAPSQVTPFPNVAAYHVDMPDAGSVLITSENVPFVVTRPTIERIWKENLSTAKLKAQKHCQEKKKRSFHCEYQDGKQWVLLAGSGNQMVSMRGTGITKTLQASLSWDFK